METDKFSNLEGGNYQVILADPPVHYWGSPDKDQAAGKHYPLLTVDKITEFDINRIAAPNAALFLWATGPKWHHAMLMIARWRWHYRNVAFVWIKTRNDGEIIHGQGVRPTCTKQNAEYVLLATRKKTGRPLPLLTEKEPQVILAPRPDGVHSRKPPQVHAAIERLFGDVKRVELFARPPVRDGWTSWGNEVG